MLGSRLAGYSKMVGDPKKPFNEKATGKEAPQHIRDKDNTAREFKPRGVEYTRPNLAPSGMSGIRRNLPTPSHEKAKDEFKVTGPGDLKREFKPIASDRDKDHGWER